MLQVPKKYIADDAKKYKEKEFVQFYEMWLKYKKITALLPRADTAFYCENLQDLILSLIILPMEKSNHLVLRIMKQNQYIIIANANLQDQIGISFILKNTIMLQISTGLKV